MSDDTEPGIVMAELREQNEVQRMCMIMTADRLARISQELREEAEHIAHDAKLLAE
jgi:hypothetical protein